MVEMQGTSTYWDESLQRETMCCRECRGAKGWVAASQHVYERGCKIVSHRPVTKSQSLQHGKVIGSNGKAIKSRWWPGMDRIEPEVVI
jgi:hypothetical protein